MFDEVKFDAATHTYTNKKTDAKYTSATSVIGKFKKPFDKLMVAKRVANRYGVTPEQVLEGWDEERDKANAKGNKIHDAMELWVESGDRDMDDPILNDAFTGFDTICPFDRKKCHSELLMYDNDHMIAGTADIIENVGRTKFNVFDFKTNKAFRFNNKYNEYMLKPLDHLQNCEYNVYSLQVSLYAYMYSKETGRKLERMSLLYYDQPNAQWYEYQTPYMKYEIMLMLKKFDKMREEEEAAVNPIVEDISDSV